MAKIIQAALATTAFVSCPALAEEYGPELWGGLYEGMSAPQVQQVLLLKPEVKKATARSKETEFGDDFDISYNGDGFVIAEIAFRLRLDMDDGKLRSVTLIPKFYGIGSCLSEGRSRYETFNTLLGQKYAPTDLIAPSIFGSRDRYIQKIYAADETYVINRVFISQHSPRTFSGSMAAKTCAADGGTTGTQSLFYISRKLMDLEIIRETATLEKVVQSEVEKL